VTVAATLLATAALPVTGGDGARAPAAAAKAPGKAFFVSPAGSDASPGTLRRPWKTVQKALDTLKPGQRALVRAGTYGRAACEDGKGGSRNGGYVTLQGYPGERPVLTGEFDGIVSVDCDYLRVQGFVIAGPAVVGGTNVYGLAGADHVRFVANEVRGSVCQGIALDPGTADWVIARNRIHDNGHDCDEQAHGIYLQGDRHLVANNVIADHPEGYGIQDYPYSRDVRIVNNTITRSGRGGIVVGGSGCNRSACGVAGTRIVNNILAYNSTYGIARNTAAPHSCELRSNLAYANGSGSYESGWPAKCFGRNVTANPQFQDQAKRNYRLRARSPAVDAGDAAAAISPAFDGVARPRGRRSDIGAYER
jgi:Right handed beta helix region